MLADEVLSVVVRSARVAFVGSLLALMLLELSAGPAPVASAEPAGMSGEMLEGINRARSEAGLQPLAEDGALDGLAFERSSDMLNRHYFSHTTPDGVTVFVLMQERGVPYQFAAENLAWNTYNSRDATRVALQGFLTSPGHRANLLNPTYNQLGIGIASGGGNTYFTVVFVG